MLWIARAWVHCDLKRYKESVESAQKGLELCERIQSLPFYRLTLRCAALWSEVEGGISRQYTVLGGRPQLEIRLSQFQTDAKEHGITQFVTIADELFLKLRTSLV